MEREIKFRAWDGQQMYLCLDNLSQPHHVASWLEAHSVYGQRGKPSIFMQYTGLKDKNGKEIYEGDIFRVADNRTYEVRWIDKLQVQSGGYETYGACFVLWVSEELFFPFDEFAFAHGEVIGNIYENSDLLAPKDKNQ